MRDLKYIELYEDGILQRRVFAKLSRAYPLRKDQEQMRRKLYKELEMAAQRNPEKVYWIELKTE